LLFLFQMFALTTWAQNKTVSGKVTDASTGSPLVGATVAAKGASKTVVSDASGNFTIEVPSTVSQLTITYTGYASIDVNITGASLTIQLSQSNTNLGDIVVIGYGSARKKDLTGSVATVGTKDFVKGALTTPEQLIQGKVAGVQITSNSGAPGAGSTIRIRGGASLNASNDPLIVIDGMPLDNGGISGQANPLALINPNDIESITVLKDASAAAIYGSRGANGVVLITTKAGRGGKKGSLTFSAATSIAETAKRYDLMKPSDFLAAAKKANIDGGADPVAAAEAVANIDNKNNTDWQDEIFRRSISQNYNLSWGFNAKSTAMRLSGSYDDQQGIIKNSALKRLTARANITQKFLNDKLKFEAAVTYSNAKNQYPPLSNNAGYLGSLLGAALQFNPTNPVYNADGSFYQPGDQRNPVQMLSYFDDRDNLNRLLSSLSGTYQITPSLSYKIVYGYDNAKTVRTAFADPRLGSNAYGGTTNIYGRDLGNGIAGNGRVTEQTLNSKSTLLEQYLTYDKTFGKSNVNAVAGYSYQNFERDYSGKVGWGISSPVVAPTDVFSKNVNGFKNYATFVPGFDNNKLQSYYGRVNYSFNDKYFLTATVRADGSSKFGSNNRYGTFPAFAFKWRVMEEGGLKDALSNVFSDFNIRANYGKLGSQDNLGSYAALNLQQTFDPGTGSQTRFIQQGNPDLKWEEVTTTGAGVDVTTANRRLSLTLDYYYTTRSNMLFFAPTPGGFAPQAYWWINLAGNVINKGWEFSLNYRIVEGKKFNWDSTTT